RRRRKRRSTRPGGRRGPRPYRGGPSLLWVHARWRGRQDAVHGDRPVVRSRQDGRAHRGQDRSDPHRPGGRAPRRLAVRRRPAVVRTNRQTATRRRGLGACGGPPVTETVGGLKPVTYEIVTETAAAR